MEKKTLRSEADIGRQKLKAYSQIENDLNELKDLLQEWITNTRKAIAELNGIADDLDRHFKNTNIGKIVGGAVGTAGGIIAAAGFGLSFFTFGLAAPIGVLGTVIAAAGGATAGGSQIANSVITNKGVNSREEILNKYKDQVEKLKLKCTEISAKLDRFGNMEEYFQDWMGFWYLLVSGDSKQQITRSSYFSDVVGVIQNAVVPGIVARQIVAPAVQAVVKPAVKAAMAPAVKAAEVVVPAARATTIIAPAAKATSVMTSAVKAAEVVIPAARATEILAPAARATGVVAPAARATGVVAPAAKAAKVLVPAMRALHVVGGVAGILFIPLDIYTMVDAAIDVHKENPNEASEEFRQAAKKLEKLIPDEATVNDMIEKTSKGLYNMLILAL